jgi:hypothetical protein
MWVVAVRGDGAAPSEGGRAIYRRPGAYGAPMPAVTAVPVFALMAAVMGVEPKVIVPLPTHRRKRR